MAAKIKTTWVLESCGMGGCHECGGFGCALITAGPKRVVIDYLRKQTNLCCYFVSVWSEGQKIRSIGSDDLKKMLKK